MAASQEQELDRSESATPYKLQEAKKRGSVGKSPDVVAAIVFAAAVAYLYAQGWQGLRDQFLFDHMLFKQATQLDTNPAAVWYLLTVVMQRSAALLAPFLITLVLAAVVGNVVQNTPTFTTKPLEPDWDRINPVNGMKRIFSLRTLYETLRALLKLSVLAIVVYQALKSLTPQFFYLAGLTALGYAHTLVNDLASMGFKIALVLGLLALLDAAYMQREFAKKMRMSRRELRDEVKHREGDPRIRARLRELRREMLKRSLSLRKTRGADVLITNPTHIAVALCYRHGEMEVPQLVAKGTGLLAGAMRRVAARHGVPIVRNPTLARQLFHQVDFDQALPGHLYPPVARIIVWVLAAKQVKLRSQTTGLTTNKETT